MKVPKKGTLSRAKYDCWKAFSLMKKLERSYDGIHVACYTCDREMEIGTSGCHMGHMLPKGGYGALYFEWNNNEPQCYHCNISLSGNTVVFVKRKIDEIGQEAFDEMYSRRSDQLKLTKAEYKEMTEKFTNRITQIKKQWR